jgi:uracil phosphoribosyltransferase
MVTILDKKTSLLNQFIAELRDTEIQKDSLRFRKNLERVGEIFAYEISKTLSYRPIDVTTPLGVAEVNILTEQPVIATVLRAGLPLHQGILSFFDRAENAFIAAYRQDLKSGGFKIVLEYLACPDLNGKTLILCDPMMATGASIELTYKTILQRGSPKNIHIVSVIASSEGLEHVKQHLPSNTHIWIGSLDEELTAESYIVPGLGDAGDLAFGEKI